MRIDTLQDAIGKSFDCVINNSEPHQLTFKDDFVVSIKDKNGTRDLSTWTIIDDVLFVEQNACFKVEDGKLISAYGDDEYVGKLIDS